MKFWNIENFKKGPVTTILGMLIIIASVVSVFVPSANISWSEAVAGITAGSLFLGLKDPSNTGGTALLMIGVILTAMCMLSCQAPATNTIKKDTVYKETKIFIKGDTVRHHIDPDAIKAMLLGLQGQGKAPVYNVPNNKGFAELRFGMDSLMNLYAECDCKDSTFKALLKEINTHQTKVVIQEKEAIPWWIPIVMIVMGIVMLILLIKSFFGKR